MFILDNLGKATVGGNLQLVEEDEIERLLGQRCFDILKVAMRPMGVNRHKFRGGLTNQRCIHLAEGLEVRVDAGEQEFPMLNVLG